MFSKGFIPFNLLLIGVFTFCTAACSSYDSSREKIRSEKPSTTLRGQFALPEQVPPPTAIQSVQLYRGNDETSPPIISLSANQQLTLEFDHLTTGVKQFKLTISHRSKNWQESPIAPTDYLEPFFETYFGDGQKSFAQNPTYYHYSYRFPNERLTITKSGNYLLSVWDYDSNDLLFRLPFFVSENKGNLHTRIKTLFAQREDARSVAQPFSEYRYPPFVQQPQFDLSFAYAQNQFWGRMQLTRQFDTATPGIVNFHLPRNDAFIADYEFNLLDLTNFDADGWQIVDVYPGETPPEVILRRDVQQFANHQTPIASSTGLPRDDRQAQYGLVKFSFEPSSTLATDTPLFIVGDFNNWIVGQQYQMAYDSTTSLWKGHSLIKQGVYRYKYVMLNDNRIDDLALDRSFSNSRQQYITFVYFRDPQQHFDRLLQVDITQQ